MSDFTLIPYDVESIKTDYLNELLTHQEWEQYSPDDPVIQLILSIIAYYVSLDIGTVNSTFVDSLPSLSASDTTLYNFANFLGVPINSRNSANGSVNFYLDNPLPAPYEIIIPYGTEISDLGQNIIYTCLENKVINPSEIQVSCSVVEGQFKEQNYISVGADNEYYIINEFIDDAYLNVYVNMVEWTRVDNFLFSTNTDKHFQLKYIKNGFKIIFSDGINGAKPQLDDNIKVTYLVSKGLDGNVSSETIKSIITNIYNSHGDLVTDLKITNNDAIDNGSNEDSIVDIKKSIKTFFMTSFNLSSREDYISYIKTNPNVLDCLVKAGWELGLDQDTYTTIYVFAVNETGSNLSLSEKQEVFDYIKERDKFMFRIEFLDCNFVGIYNEISVKPKNKLSPISINDLNTKIQTILTDYYDFNTLVDNDETIFRDIYNSEIIKKIMNIEEYQILKVNVNLFSVEETYTFQESNINYINYIMKYRYFFLAHKRDNIKLYFNSTEIGEYFFDNVDTWDLTVTNDIYKKSTVDFDGIDGSYFSVGAMDYCKYFLVDGLELNYYVWIRTDSIGLDPTVTNKTGILIEIGNADTDSQIATKVKNGIDAITGLKSILDGTKKIRIKDEDTNSALTIYDNDTLLPVESKIATVESEIIESSEEYALRIIPEFYLVDSDEEVNIVNMIAYIRTKAENGDDIYIGEDFNLVFNYYDKEIINL